MTAQVRPLGPGILGLTGVLDYQTGPALRSAGRRLIRAEQGPLVRLDCSGVQQSSSVGLSLLLCFMRDAHACGKRLEVAGMPSEMQQIAAVSGLDQLLASE